MPIADWSTYKAKAQSEVIRASFFAESWTGLNAGQWTSLWTKMLPTAGATPTSAASPSRTAAGALSQPGTSNVQRLIKLSGVLGDSAALMMYDRLVHMGGLSGTVTTAQTTSMAGTLPARASTGDGVFAAFEVYTQVGSTTTTATCAYTNSSGVSQTTQPVSFGGSDKGVAGKFLPIALATGDTGVRSIDSVTLASTTGSAGNFGVTLYKPLLVVPFLAYGNEPHVFDPMLDLAANMPRTDECCLAFCIMSSASFGFGTMLWDFFFCEE